MTSFSAVATFTACTAPKSSPMKPLTIPDAWRLARRYCLNRFVVALATMPTTMKGRMASPVMVALICTMTITATTQKATSPSRSFSHSAKSGISKISPRKRLTASPGESGSADAPGRRRMCRSRLRRSMRHGMHEERHVGH